jgi:PHD/YefM family antitoxin component YafN of YafNO toxin-antitoxin module
MELSEIRAKIENTIKTLPPQKLKIALDFLEDLQRTDEEETSLLLNNPGFMEDYRQAKEDIRTGKTISWEDIKRDV